MPDLNGGEYPKDCNEPRVGGESSSVLQQHSEERGGRQQSSFRLFAFREPHMPRDDQQHQDNDVVPQDLPSGDSVGRRNVGTPGEIGSHQLH